MRMRMRRMKTKPMRSAMKKRMRMKRIPKIKSKKKILKNKRMKMMMKKKMKIFKTSSKSSCSSSRPERS